jgi:hypothetical protein
MRGSPISRASSGRARRLRSFAFESPVAANVLARFAPDQLEKLVFGLQPSLQLVASDFPIFTVWSANQAENAPPVDQSLAGECGMVLGRSELLEVRQLEPDSSLIYARCRRVLPWARLSPWPASIRRHS